MLNRRLFLQSSSAGLLAGTLVPNVAFAKAPTDKRFVLIFLRGGLDGLHALVPYADKQYQALRPRLAISNPLKIGGYFGLNPELKNLHQFYKTGDLTLIPAAATGYRQRSHFDAQNFLENGSGQPYGAADGWLNRALGHMGDGQARLGLSVGHQVPLILQGRQRVQTWSESSLPEVSDNFMNSLSKVYKGDDIFAAALRDAQNTMEPDLPANMRAKRSLARPDVVRSADAAAQLLAMADGPRVAVIESRGWDSHQNQTPQIARLLRDIDQSVLKLKTGLSQHWDNTVVMIVSEFGRTVAENANRGTDHGTGGLLILAGGGVKGGRVAGDWPGLSGKALYEGRDLKPVNTTEAVFKSVLISHLGISDSHVADQIFPGNPVAPMNGLFI